MSGSLLLEAGGVPAHGFYLIRKQNLKKPSINDHLSLNMKRGGVFTPPLHYCSFES